MKIQKIYEEYNIMPQLQLHMLRVAGVSSIICDHFTKPVNKKAIITASLLHDMGNIVKSNLEFFPDMLKVKGLSYWIEVKRKFIDTYGKDEHKATLKIVNKIGPEKNVTAILQDFEFADTVELSISGNLEKYITKYSDLRVTPYGTDTLNARFKEAKKRYVDEKNIWSESEFNKLASVWRNIENKIFTFSKIKPEDITEEKVLPLLEQLRNFEIGTVRT